ncbi:MAG: hypothetical protein KDB03_16680 [Planctomycetales bacterium]|nr:hypothetical protein [Planctomycetales bacterium]
MNRYSGHGLGTNKRPRKLIDFRSAQMKYLTIRRGTMFGATGFGATGFGVTGFGATELGISWHG